MLGYTWRACLPARRRWLLLLFAAGVVVFGVVGSLDGRDRTESFAEAASLGIFALVLPLACLVIGDAVLGSEVRSGTLALTWLSPVPFRSIVVARWLAGSVVAAAVLVPAGVAAALVADLPSSAAPMALALGTGALAYVAVFAAIGVLARRAAVWSIAFVLLVERLVGTAVSGIAQLSPLWLAQSVYSGLAPGASEHLDRSGVPDGWEAVARLALIAGVALVVSTRRIARIQLTGADD